jgi:hypothetical protein
MPLRHLVVTPLPDGRTGNVLRLSVLLSPRLREFGLLSDYPDWSDWGRFVSLPGAPLQFRVIVDGAPIPAAAVTVTSAPVDQRVWRAAFGNPPNNVSVEPTTFVDRTAVSLVAMDSAATAASLGSLAAGVAALESNQITQAALSVLAADALALVPSARTYFGLVGDGADPSDPSTEFHAQLAFLLAHPALVRSLGLAFDLEISVPAAVVPAEIAVQTNWVAKTGTANPRDEIALRVAVDAAFRPIVVEPAYRTSGWLTLGGSKYAVSQLDLAYAVNQMAHLGDVLAAEPEPTAPVEVPALVESGLSVIHTELADVLRSRFDRQREVEDGIDDFVTGAAPRPPVLFAEDITLGQRYDVLDVTAAAPYRSLHDRQLPNGYRFPTDPTLVVAPPPDQGWGSTALSTDGALGGTDVSTTVRYPQESGPQITKTERRDDTAWRVNDHIVTWGGWSLSTPKPGNTTTSSGEVVPPKETAPLATSPVQVAAVYAHVNGTLPKLRYSHDYRFRARCVDMVGNGETLAAAAPIEAESPLIRFGRMTPLSPPIVIRRESRADPGVGDRADVIVIKSELTQSNASTPPADRLLFPPSISQVIVERHDLPNGGNDPASYALLAERDARSLEDQTLVDPETGELVAGTAIVDGAVTAGPTIATAAYLADPAARRISFIGLPNAAAPTTVVEVGAWPAVRTWNLQLRAGTAAPTVSNASRRITARLPKGTVQTVDISSAPDLAFLPHFAAAASISDPAPAIAGRLPAISPSRRLTLVHAVRLPLQPPGFGTTTATRTEVGQTDMVIDLTNTLHRPTTDRLLVAGRWVDPVDDPNEPAPIDVIGRAVVADLPVPLDGPATSASYPGLRYDLGDTKRRQVRLTSDAFCRFSTYFTERLDTAIDVAAGIDLDARGVAAGTVTLSDLDTGAVHRNGVDFDVDGPSGRLSVLDTVTIPIGSNVRAEYVPLPVSRPSSQSSSATTRQAVVDVPASLAPATPVVSAVLPAFARTVTATSNQIRIVHDGRVIRVHLERPWYSSGSGEELGVAIDPTGTVDRVLTDWSRDPLVAGPGTTVGPTMTSFTRATARVAAVDGLFDLAAHGVTFDVDRGIWTADVVVAAAFSYRPFVQLHVCRYQSLAVDGQHVSPTVETDPVRLGARRVVTVVPLSGGRVRARLTGRDAVNQVRVVLQWKDPGDTDPDVGWIDERELTATRTGTTAAATHTATLASQAPSSTRRLLIEESEAVVTFIDGIESTQWLVAYREVVDLPTTW